MTTGRRRGRRAGRRPACRRRRCSVFSPAPAASDQAVQLDELVLRERLGGEEVERAGGGVVAGPRRGRGGCSRASCPMAVGVTTTTFRPAMDRLVGGGLVGVRRLDAPRAQGVHDAFVDRLRPRGVARGTRGKLTVRRDERGKGRIGEQGRDGRVGIGGWCGQHRSSSSSTSKPNRCSVGEHSTSVRSVGSGCDRSCVALGERWQGSARLARDDRDRTRSTARRPSAVPPPHPASGDARRHGLDGGPAHRRHLAGGPVRSPGVRELADRPARGGHRGADRRGGGRESRAPGGAATTCAAMRT